MSMETDICGGINWVNMLRKRWNIEILIASYEIFTLIIIIRGTFVVAIFQVQKNIKQINER